MNPTLSSSDWSKARTTTLPPGVSGEHLDNLSARPLSILAKMMEVKPAKGLLIFAAFVFKTLPILIFPLFIEHLVDSLVDPTPEKMKWCFIMGGGLALLQALNIPGHTYYIHLISSHIRDVEKKLRSSLIRHLQYLSIRFHHQTQSGELQAKVLRDVEQVENLVRTMATKTFEIFLVLVFAITVTWIKEPLMLLFYIFAIPLCIGIMKLFKGHLKEGNAAFRQEMENMSASVSEMIDMIPVTKAHGLETHEIDRVEKNLNDIHHSGRRLDRVNALFESSSFMTFQFTTLVCLVFTGWLCYQGVITVAELVLYKTLFALIVQSVGHVLALVPQISKGMASLQSLGDILSDKDLELGSGKRELKRLDGNIEFRNVSFSYEKEGGELALDDLSFKAWPGDCIAFVGESGSGKSTAMNMIIGFFRAQEGQVLLDGVEQGELNLQHWRKSVAVVPQQVLLFSGTLRDNICYGVKNPCEDQLQEVVRAAHLESVVEGLPLGLETLIGENGVRLSGGQRQRIAIARALMRDPKVIVLDEATSALDVISEREVQLAIDELVKGRTTFIVAHRLSTIRQANRVIVMKDGRAVESGTQEELMALDGEFARLKNLQ